MKKVMMDWNHLHVGEGFGPYLYEVTPEIADTYRDAMGDMEVRDVDGVSVIPPTLLTFPVLQMVDDKYIQRPGMVHTQQDFNFLSPVRVGSRLSTVGTLTHMFLKKSRRYLVIETVTSDETGRQILTARMQLMHPSDAVEIQP